MELRDLKVLDSDAHARDLDNDIRQYLPEPYKSQRSSFIPSEHYDRNLGGTLGRSGAKVEERLEARFVAGNIHFGCRQNLSKNWLHALSDPKESQIGGMSSIHGVFAVAPQQLP